MVTVKELLVEEEATIDAIHQLKEQISVAEMEKEELEFNLWTQTNFSKEGLSKVPKICSKVVLPAPELPTIETISPLETDVLMPLRICTPG